MKTFIKKGSKGQIRVWKIEVIKDQVHRWSGQKDGAMTLTYDTPGPAGKVGTKAYVTAEDRAIERALYLIKKKKDAGYREADPKTLKLIEEEADTDINWFKHELPRNFEIGKPLDPKTKRDLKARDELVNSENSIITLKEDGLCFVIMISYDNIVQIYSRKMEYFTSHFWYIIRAVKAMHFPAKTILTCEFVIKKLDGRDDRKAMQSLKGKAETALDRQKNPHWRPTAVILNTPYWAGEPVLKTEPVVDWMGRLQDFCEDRGCDIRSEGYIRPVEILYGNFDQCKQYVLDNEHEGLVIYDKTSCFGEKAFNFRGTTERTPCFKWKPYFETDCVMVFNPDMEFGPAAPFGEGGMYGTAGKVRDLPKNVSLFQLDDAGNPVFLSNCGSGFTIDQRKQVLELAKKNGGVVGVAEIRYATRFFKSRGDDTNALLEPIFKDLHSDKEPAEVIEPKLLVWS